METFKLFKAIGQTKFLLMGCLILIISSLLSCTYDPHENDPKPQPEEEIVKKDTIKPGPNNLDIFTEIIKEKSGKWLRYQRKFNKTFDLKNFKRLISTRLNLSALDFRYDARSVPKHFRNYFVFTTDSSRFIDIYSKNIKFSKDSWGDLIVNGTATSSVEIVTIKKLRTRNIIFTDKASTLDDALWVNNFTFLLLGNNIEFEGDKFLPMVWRVNLKDKVIDTYTYEAELKDPEYWYWDLKFSKILNKGLPY